ncbi:MAG TPA: hypothetical protein VFV88_06300 [Steroidobacteraceae bacterium]|jgi:hypothetical protein|nr:hypothetical protein [Steroidobacteraceae bacterium]
MRIAAALALLIVGALPAFSRDSAKSAQYIDLTADFTRFVDATAGMEEAARVAQFRKQMDALLPGFYMPPFGMTEDKYNAHIAKALQKFPTLRPQYEQVQRDFPAAFEAGIEHFRKQFPGFTPNVPVYLLHSVGEMDGGTRELNGRIYLIFGADVIASIHKPDEITPFLDHELFHVENGRFFPECGEVWCSLWAEGLATYAAKVMNPGASDRQLLLTYPTPIRPIVEPHWPDALCYTRDRLFSKEQRDIEELFVGNSGGRQFPERFGYYVGLRVAEEAGAKHTLAELAHMPPAVAKSVIEKAVATLIGRAGGCN